MRQAAGPLQESRVRHALVAPHEGDFIGIFPGVVVEHVGQRLRNAGHSFLQILYRRLHQSKTEH